MRRLERLFRRKRSAGEKTLALFLTAGLPHPRTTADLALGLHEAGADILEIGMPFSDPLADGPVVQEASRRALESGVRMGDVLETVAAVRSRSDVPIVLMGYLNPILRYGRDRFLADAAGAGADGLILPEVPLEEHVLLRDAIGASGLSWVQLVTPASSDGRIRRIDRVSAGFLYCVSLNGVTGARMASIDAAYLRRIRAAARRNPVLAGFGIATPADARAMSGIVDGVVVGSALLSRVLAGESGAALRSWVGDLRDAMRPPS